MMAATTQTVSERPVTLPRATRCFDGWLAVIADAVLLWTTYYAQLANRRLFATLLIGSIALASGLAVGGIRFSRGIQRVASLIALIIAGWFFVEYVQFGLSHWDRVANYWLKPDQD